MRKGKAGKGRGSQASRKRAPLAGLAVAAVRRRLSPIARACAAALEDRSRNKLILPKILIGYGGRANEGLAEVTQHCRRSCMRGIKELEEARLIRVEGPTREGKSYRGRRRWFQRVGGRMEGGQGRANEYWPGEALGFAAARPRVGPPVQAGDDDESPEQRLASAENRRALATMMLESAERAVAAARASP